MSNIAQLDGQVISNIICIYEDDDSRCSVDINMTTYNTEDEIEPETAPISITPPQDPFIINQTISKH